MSNNHIFIVVHAFEQYELTLGYTVHTGGVEIARPDSAAPA